jgi:hypothetical protein
VIRGRPVVLVPGLRLNPWDERGLTGTVRLARMRDADEALALIADDLLGVSAGFAIGAGGEDWHGNRKTGATSTDRSCRARPRASLRGRKDHRCPRPRAARATLNVSDVQRRRVEAAAAVCVGRRPA